jgi:hypothetical protein
MLETRSVTANTRCSEYVAQELHTTFADLGAAEQQNRPRRRRGALRFVCLPAPKGRNMATSDLQDFLPLRQIMSVRQQTLHLLDKYSKTAVAKDNSI